ncbi:MAG: thioredoxin [Bacteroidetes bacterium]|nr:thioredoxin [Bacteroidota bacterium]
MKKPFKEIVEGEVPVLVDFHATWCGPCKTMAPALQAFATEMGDRLRVIKIDVDRNPQVALDYKIQGVPTLILFKEGKPVWRQSGVLSTFQMHQGLSPFL